MMNSLERQLFREAFIRGFKHAKQKYRDYLFESSEDDGSDKLVRGLATGTSFDKFLKSLNLLNRRLEAEGKEKVRYRILSRDYRPLGEVIPKLVKKGDPYYGYEVEVVEYEISPGIGDYLAEAGYEIVAVIDHKEDMIYNIRNCPGVEKYRHRSECDLCHTSRYRVKTFILKDEETGELAQIGSNCVKAYTGVDPSTLLKQIDVIYYDLVNLKDYVPEDDEDGGGWGMLIPWDDIRPSTWYAVRNSIIIINKFGFVPKKDEDPIRGIYPTKERVIDSFRRIPKGEPGFFKANDISNEEIEKAEEHVDEVIEWMQNLYVGDNDFKGNLKQMAKNKYVTDKSMGYLCAGVNLYFRNQKYNEQTKEEGKEFFGKIGERVEIKNLEVLSTRGYQSMYGDGLVITLKDPEQRLFVWFCSTDDHPSIGDKVDMIATIKDHKEFRGKKQTYINRCKVVRYGQSKNSKIIPIENGELIEPIKKRIYELSKLEVKKIFDEFWKDYGDHVERIVRRNPKAVILKDGTYSENNEDFVNKVYEKFSTWFINDIRNNKKTQYTQKEIDEFLEVAKKQARVFARVHFRNVYYNMYEDYMYGYIK